MMDYARVLDFLYTNLPMYQRDGKIAFKKDLSNTFELCEKLKNPQHKFPAIHIAGTNGKGSSAHSLAAIYQAAGYKTGLYTSPHLKNFTERIRINGREIKKEAVIAFVENNWSAIHDIQPSFFEITVAMAFDYFASEKVDLGIIEVGLGGRLDSTNILHPELCLITNIGLDHTDMLGNTLVEIAGEKAGIIKPGVPVVVSETQPDIREVFEKKAKRENAPIYFADQEYAVSNMETGLSQTRVDVSKNHEPCFEGLHVDLGGAYQLKNLPGIIKSVELLNEQGFLVSGDAIYKGLKEVKSLTGIKGRWQILQEKPRIICDTAHNSEGLTVVLQQIKDLNPENLFMIIGMVNDKIPEKVLSLLPKNAFYYFCQASIPRALEADQLKLEAEKFGLKGKIIPNVNQALNEAKKRAEPEDLIFIGGSSFLVAEIEDL